MKLFYSTSLFLILCFYSLNAFARKDPFGASVFIGVNGIQFEGNTNQFWENNNGTIWGGGGLSAGGQVHASLGKSVYFGFGLCYTQKGSIYEYTSDFGSPVHEFCRLNYIEAPVIIGVNGKVNNRKIKFETGIAYGKMFLSSLSIAEMSNRFTNTKMENFKTNDLSWIAAIKLPLKIMKKEKLWIGLRSSYSLFSIHEYYKLRNFVYGIELSYFLKHSG